MMKDFYIAILDVSTRENLIAEIHYNARQWAEISQETEDMLIQLYTYPRQEFWEFPLDLTIEALEKAKVGLLRIGQIEKTKMQIRIDSILKIIRRVFKRIRGFFVGVFLALRIIEYFKIVLERTPERTKSVVKIFYNRILWAEIFQETEEIQVRFYPHPKKDCLEFPVDLPAETLKMARQRFLDEVKVV